MLLKLFKLVPLCCSSQVGLIAFVMYHTIILTFMINVRFFSNKSSFSYKNLIY